MYSVCIPSYVCMYPYSYPSTHGIYIWTGCRRCLRAIRGAPQNDDWVNTGIHANAVIERVGRYTWRQWYSECVDELCGHDRANLDAVIEWDWRYTLRLWSSEFGDHNRVSLEMHLQAVIEWLWRCTWRPRSSKIGDTLGGCDRASLEMHLEAVIKQVRKP